MVANNKDCLANRLCVIVHDTRHRHGRFFITQVKIFFRHHFTYFHRGFSIFCRKLRNPRNRLHMHLFASFIMRAFMALLKDWLFVDGVGLAWDVVSVDGKSTFIKEHNVNKIIFCDLARKTESFSTSVEEVYFPSLVQR